jgi:uncharacterized OsmC-like protein
MAEGLLRSLPDPSKAAGTEAEQLAVYRQVRDDLRTRIGAELLSAIARCSEKPAVAQQCCDRATRTLRTRRNTAMSSMHNVRVDNARQTAEKAKSDPSAAQLKVDLAGDWRVDETKPQFGGTVKFAAGETVFEADFPAFLSGDGRAPSPLIYCFWGALSCYASTFAMQAAMAGIEIRALRSRLRLMVDFRGALGVADVVPLDTFRFEIEVETDASPADVARVKQLADERCPAIWAMDHQVPHTTEVRKA